MPSGQADRTRTLVRVGAVSDFTEGECRLVEAGGHEIGVYNLGGALYAIRNFCPHRGAPICRGQLHGTMLPSDPSKYVYGMHGVVLKCPWHRWEFDIATGNTLFGIDKRRLITYPVVVRDDDVLIEMRLGTEVSTEVTASRSSDD